MAKTRTRGVLITGVTTIVLFFAASTSLVPSVAAAQDSTPPVPYPEDSETHPLYYSSIDHGIRGPFVDFFRRHGRLAIFGYPQTEVFYDWRIGLWVQYFDNVRMEWHPENPEPYRVELGLLGDILGHGMPRIPPDQAPAGNPLRQYFEETGHVVSYAFLLFFYQNGGLDIFGYPISEPIIENGCIVQYFQRARMEWHPERPPDERVLLGPLGLAYIQRFGVSREAPGSGTYSDPEVESVAPSPSLNVLALLRNALTDQEGDQTVFIQVTNELGEPVHGAEATVTVRYPLTTAEYQAWPTDERGITTVPFSIPSDPEKAPSPGQSVVVDVTVQANQLDANTQTFFVPWY